MNDNFKLLYKTSQKVQITRAVLFWKIGSENYARSGELCQKYASTISQSLIDWLSLRISIS